MQHRRRFANEAATASLANVYAADEAFLIDFVSTPTFL